MSHCRHSELLLKTVFSMLEGKMTGKIDQFSSVAQLYPTLWDPMNRSTPGLPVHHQLPEFTQTHIRWVVDAIQPSHPLSSPSTSCHKSLPAPGSFPMSQLFSWSGQSIGVSASASVLPMNTQDWSPLGWTGWMSLKSKELSRVFSSITIQKHIKIYVQNSNRILFNINMHETEKSKVFSWNITGKGYFPFLNLDFK